MKISFHFAMRTCAIAMAVAALLVLIVFGFTFWSLLGFVLLLACPVYVFWAVAELDESLPKPRAGEKTDDPHR